MISEINITLPEDVELYSAKTAAKSTSFSERYFIEHIRKGNIPVVRIGRSVRIKREDLLTFLEAEIKEGKKEEEKSQPQKRSGHVFKRRSPKAKQPTNTKSDEV